MIEHELDRKLLDRTVELAKQTGGFGWQKARAVLDSSPLLGAGRVLDTWNLIGRALSAVVECAAKVTHHPREMIVDEAKLTLISGSSLKAALDIDWDDDEQRTLGLGKLLSEVDAVEKWVRDHASAEAAKDPLRKALGLLRQVVAQDLEPDPSTGRHRIRRGVAKDRIVSIGDPEMRHGRKSKSRLFNGYKRHVVQINGVVVGVRVLPGNQSEQEALPSLLAQARAHADVVDIDMDRGYLASPLVGEMYRAGVGIHCRPWASHNRGRFGKADFDIRIADGIVVCPAGVEAKISVAGHGAHFPAARCAACPLREKCTTASAGRSISIHDNEKLLIELRDLIENTEGRARLRMRVEIEHTLARMGQIQGHKARYEGTRKNDLDCRRSGAIINLQKTARHRRAA